MRFSRGWDTEGKRDRLYGRRWRKARALYLAAHPLCAMCANAGRTTVATVVDHVVPHRGDEARFWDEGNWQALCEPHHNGAKASEEIRGYSTALGDDGWPLDAAHPANSGVEPLSGKSKPDDLKPIAVRVFLVIGPPAVGKSMWCRDQARDGDVVIDFDDIDREINGTSRRRGRLLVPILRERKARLLHAAEMKSGRVFLPMTAARSAEREWWRKKLGNVLVVHVAASIDECLARVDHDKARCATAPEMKQAIQAWFEAFDDAGVDLVVPGGGASDHQNGRGGTPHPQTNSYLVSDTYSARHVRDDDDVGFA